LIAKNVKLACFGNIFEQLHSLLLKVKLI